MNEQDDLRFDALLTEDLSALPPGDNDLANPWEGPIQRIALGLALTTLHLNLLWLEYILPTVGTLLLFLGFRSLRRENRWFTAAWFLSGLKMAGQALSLLEAATPWQAPAIETGAPWVIVLTVCLQSGFFLLFRQALKKVFQKAGVAQEKDPLLGMAVWTVVVAFLAVSPLSQSWLAFLPTVAFYIYLCRSLYDLPDSLGDAGYALVDAPVRVSDRTVRLWYLLGCLLLTLACNLASAHLPLDSRPYISPAVSETRQRLESLGFPAGLLADLPDSEVEQMAGAVFVDTSQELLMFDPHSEPRYNTYDLIYEYRDEPGNSNLNVTSAVVQLPDNRFHACVFFEWENHAYGDDHSPFWTDGFSLSIDDAQTSGYAGALLYEKDGLTWAAPIPELEQSTRTGQGFFGSYTLEHFSGKVNYPAGADRRRGWLTVSFSLPEDQWLSCLSLNYQRVTGPLRFPYQDPVDQIFAGFLGNDNKKQYYTTFETLSRHETYANDEDGT